MGVQTISMRVIHSYIPGRYLLSYWWRPRVRTLSVMWACTYTIVYL